MTNKLFSDSVRRERQERWIKSIRQCNRKFQFNKILLMKVEKFIF